MGTNIIQFPVKPVSRNMLITIMLNSKLYGHILTIDGGDRCATPVDTFEARECYRMRAPEALNVWFGDSRKALRI